jgi:hypothetical protein
MRNILVFPDGTMQDFMYPADREIQEGEVLRSIGMDDSVHMLRVTSIVKEEKRILYYLHY